MVTRPLSIQMVVRAQKGNDPMVHRIALIHAVAVAMEPIEAAFCAIWPAAQRMNLLDDSLSADRAAAAKLTSGFHARMSALVAYAASTGCHGVLFTCSAFGPAIETAARTFSGPVLKPNEAMFAAALNRGGAIGMLATFEPSVASMEEEFREMAEARESSATIRTICVPKAMEALKRGDGDEHNRLLAEAATKFDDCSAVLLAHFSTSRAFAAVKERTRAPVLTAPGAAVTELKTALGA
jgi:Asp/Glu/hydantoin racemase